MYIDFAVLMQQVHYLNLYRLRGFSSMYPPIKYKRSKNMEYYSEIMCDEIYADYEPIEPSEDYDLIADMLYTLGLRYYDVMGNCCKDYRNAFRPLEAFLYKVFSDHESFYEFMNCP